MDFNTISYEEWIARLQKELRSEDLSKFHVEISKGQTTDPFFQRIINRELGNRIEKDWEMKHIFHGSFVSNDQLLLALEGGINSIEILEAEKISDIEGLFQNIHLDFISLHLHFTEKAEESATACKTFIATHANAEKFNISYYPFDSLNFNFTSDKEIVNELSGIFNEIIDTIDDSYNLESTAKKIRITRSLSKDIVREIAIKKAISLLWVNTLNGFNLINIPLTTHASCEAELDKDLESKYIALSAKGLTAIIAGYDNVYIAPASTEKEVFHQRISRNVHHLLNMESFIQKSNEAFTGSYQIERIAKEIASACWKKIGRH